jgi:hypothetical protein
VGSISSTRPAAWTSAPPAQPPRQARNGRPRLDRMTRMGVYGIVRWCSEPAATSVAQDACTEVLHSRESIALARLPRPRLGCACWGARGCWPGRTPGAGGAAGSALR